MKDFAFMHKSLIKEVAKFENLQKANSMNNLGLNYEINYGLGLKQLDQIASIIDPDDNYAKYLWKQKERESKLIALRIFKTKNFNVIDLEEFVKNLNNVELAEQSAMYLFSKQNNVIELALSLIKKSDFAQLAAYLTISRFAMLNKNKETGIFENLLDELIKNRPTNKALYFKRGFAQSLLRIALINKELKERVNKFIQEIKKDDKDFYEYLNQEVIELLY